MLQELKLNDVVVAKDLRVYYYETLKIKNDPHSFPLFSTSKDAYKSLFSDPQNYFKHLVSNDHIGAQYITDNLDLVLRKASNLHETGEYPWFDHYAKDINTEVAIRYRVNVASCNDKKVLFIKNLPHHECRSLYNKIIKLHEVLQ